MRYIHTYYATNRARQSPVFEALDQAIAWAADAATNYHSLVLCTTTEMPDDDDRVLEVRTTEIGAVLRGSRNMLDRLDSRTVGYPTW